MSIIACVHTYTHAHPAGMCRGLKKHAEAYMSGMICNEHHENYLSIWSGANTEN